MNKELKEKLAHSAANDWCNCYKCDGVVNTTGLRCDKPVAPCMAWYDAYRGAMIALGKYQPTWHSVDECLPEVDEEVIVLTDDLGTAPVYKIAFGHIVNNERCEDYNGWNIPGVKFWMPCPEISKEE